MMTFKDLKKLVELPSYKEQRVPTVKALEVSGVPVVAEKTLENHGSISVYQNGYVIYRAHAHPVCNGMPEEQYHTGTKYQTISACHIV